MDSEMTKHHLTRTIGALLALTLLLGGVAAFAAGSAYAGDWMEVSCENPNLSGAPSQGWTSFSAGGGYGSTNSTGCGPGNPMFAILSTAAAVGVGSAETLEWAPPTGSTLVGGSIDASLYADGGGFNASGTAVLYTPNYVYDGSNVVLQCASGLPPCANGTYDYAGVIDIPGGRGGNLYLSAGCGGTPGYSCNTGGSEGAWSLVRLWWANLLLSNTSTPTASGVSGTLLNQNARGTQDLTFNASDPGGPGIYTATLQVDGKTLYTGTPDNNGGKCVAVGSSGGALMFDYSQPCRASESIDLPINTTAVPDGQHTLKVTLQDAAQNQSVIYDNTITTNNAPTNTTTPTIQTPSPILPGATLQAQPGTWSAPATAGTIAYGYQWQDCDSQGNNCQTIPAAQNTSYTPTASDAGHTLRVLVSAADNDGKNTQASDVTSVVLAPPAPPTSPNGPGTGAANGTPASETPILHLTGSKKLHLPNVHLPYAHRAFTFEGTLTDSQGHPIAGATLDVLQQISTSSNLVLVKQVQTGQAGTFTAAIPAGPSRRIEIAYRAFANDPNYTTTATVDETVNAGVQLHVNTHNTTSTGTITLTGKVAGPIPPLGTIVNLLVYYHHQWVTIRTPRTNSHGTFHIPYQFQGATGHFPFQIEIPAGQANFPYASGHSNKINITSR